MSHFHSYLNSAKQILQLYRGEEPFASFLKKYFAVNKKYGSRDRKQIAHLCYCFLRLGKAVMNVSLDEKMLIALFLCSDKSNEMLAALKPEWNDKCHLPVKEKLSVINYPLSITAIFPWKEELSEGMDYEKFCKSFFVQPDLFLRLRPGNEESVKLKLKNAGIDFKEISHSCLALPNASKIDSVIEPDKEAVIQDYNSQRIGDYLKNYKLQTINHKLKFWDCCAGSGGKSIMAYDINPNIELTVSDERESILGNLKKRFEKAGIKKYKTLITDLTSRLPTPNSQFQTIICDAPCTGSGTWSRTPEQLYYFDESKIEEYADLQKKIVSKIIPHLESGGTFIYITCSVFRKENEEVVNFIQKKFSLKLEQMELLKGYDNLPAGKAGKADSMFVALLE